MAVDPLGVSKKRTMWRQIGAMARSGQLRVAGHNPRTVAGFGFARLVGVSHAQEEAIAYEPLHQAAVEAFENEGGPVRRDGSPQPAHSYLVEQGQRDKANSRYVRT